MTKEDSLKNLERVNFWVSNCDGKVSFLLVIQGVVLSIIFTSSYSTVFLETLSRQFSFDNLTTKTFLNFIEGSFLLLFFLCIFLSFYNIYNVLSARLDPAIFKQKGLEVNSHLFFNTIAQKEFAKFKSDNETITEDALLNDIDSQVYINSKICSLKFYHYNLSLKYSAASFLFGVIYLLIRLKVNV
jgi:hypothetical protein